MLIESLMISLVGLVSIGFFFTITIILFMYIIKRFRKERKNYMDEETKSPGIIKSFFERHSVTLKLIGIGIIILVLLIPLGMIRSVLYERINRRDYAVDEITSTWGREQAIVGPVLMIPYQYKVKVWKDKIVNDKLEKIEVEETAIANAFFLPDDITIEGWVEPSTLHRGIYDAVVYKGKLNISASFSEPNYLGLGISEGDLQWENAHITLAVSDLRGTGGILKIKIGDETCTFSPGCLLSGYSSGISTRLSGVHGKISDLKFEMTFDLKGSKGIRFAPVGKQNRIKLISPWAAPSFIGAFLPSERKADKNGFDALWEISWYGRGYPQQSTSNNNKINESAITSSLFGVDFIVLIDTYRMVERSIKYGILFIVLVFTAFFLFEILSSLRIHTIQYTLVGAALCLFYLAVLSLSEFIRFVYAYWIGVAASSLLIILYSLKILKSGQRTLIIAADLIAVYTYLFVILQMQDYSLLFGTAALFLVLGLIMYFTRNLDWTKRL